MSYSDDRALIFDIKRDCSEDGPGIRTTVFFKGCALSCVWCQNPEGLSAKPGISFHQDLCHPHACDHACVKVCPEHCLSFVDKLHIDHDRCTRCDKCFSACPTNALEPVGYWITQDELLYRVLIDEKIFKSSGGGVTLSGGEASRQYHFVSTFLQALKEREIHTAIETSGFFNYAKFESQLLPYLDLIYFDLKLMDDTQSRKFTGQTNTIIQENLRKLANKEGLDLRVRVPLIPGITDTRENLQAIATFLKALKISSVNLMPYNPLWQGKLDSLGMEARYQRQSFMSPDELRNSIQKFHALDLQGESNAN